MEIRINKPEEGEKTGGQVVTSFGGSLGLGQSPLPADYETYRLMRTDPTIALARAIAAAPIVSAKWSIESDDDAPEDWVKLIQDQFIETREPLVEAALMGGIDFGHQGFEKVFAVKENRVRLVKLKPLLQDLTEILIDKDTGAFLGFKQKGVTLPLENSLLISFRVEGTQWHGQPLLETAREAWNQWRKANAGAARYDEKLAGSHWIVYYPLGESLDVSGTATDNAELARRILRTLESSGSVAVPQDVAAFVGEFTPSYKDKPSWDIKIIGDSGGRQPSFVERLRYLDTLKVRAMLVPERAILEGSHGTLAEAGEHIDLAMTVADLTHRHITRVLNWHAVDHVLALNYGEESRGKVRLKAAPIRDEAKGYLRTVYDKILSNPAGFLEEFGMIDTGALKDSLGIPAAEEVADANKDGNVPIEGVDADDPMAETVRRLYRQGVNANGGSSQ